MSVQQPSDELWGAETRKAVANFPVSGEPVPVAVVRWLGRTEAVDRAIPVSRAVPELLKPALP